MTTHADPSGAFYDWRKTRRPEQPYRHAYHLSVVDKIFLCRKPNPQTGAPAQVLCTFAEALERIRKVDNLTRGIPKIMYLVGWQFEGHDSKYPAWSEVNALLKRPEDATALDSLRRLMAEARQYHTTVSLHVNMNDAYENSPDWPAFRDAGVIERAGGVWDGEQSYLICHEREWAAGLAQKRIDALLEMLPIADAGTIHVDAFWAVGSDHDAELAAMRKIIRYWRDRGVDVTAEGITEPDFGKGLVGLVPMVWHLNVAGWGRTDEYRDEHYMEMPASLFCGGVDHSPRALLFGTSMQGEGVPNAEIERYLPLFCLGTLPWQYLNRHERLRLERGGDAQELRLSDGLVSQVAGGRPTLRHGDLLLRDGNDLFVPALWQDRPEVIAFSEEGYAGRRWMLPPDWPVCRSVCVREITPEGLGAPAEAPAADGGVELSLSAGQAVSVTPA